MLNYSDLNKTQKRIVDAFIARRPELANTDRISRVEIEELWYTMYAERATGGPKMGYPGWLVKGDKLARGMYPFPAPNVTHAKDPLPKPITQKVAKARILGTAVEQEVNEVAAKHAAEKKAEDDASFFAELQEFGITA